MSRYRSPVSDLSHIRKGMAKAASSEAGFPGECRLPGGFRRVFP